VRSRKFYLTGANGENGEWKNGTLEEWNIARLEDWNTGRLENRKIGKSEHHSIIPSFRVFTFRFSIIPSFQYSNTPSALGCLC
jgi:hypothetical protein